MERLETVKNNLENIDSPMASISIPVKITPQIWIGVLVVIFLAGFGFGKYLGGSSLEGFTTGGVKEGLAGIPMCSTCRRSAPQCGCCFQP